jgi:hypothetical protein
VHQDQMSAMPSIADAVGPIQAASHPVLFTGVCSLL